MKIHDFTLMAVFMATGCATAPIAPDLNAIYDEAAQRHGPETNPIIVIPGILGSKLRDAETGKLVWGAFEREAANPRRAEDARLMALPMRPGVALAGLEDGVRPDGALDTLRVSLFPGVSIEPKAYISILLTLGAGGYMDQLLGEAGAIDYGDDHYTCFQFDYDWRRSCVENAARLGEFIEAKKRFVEDGNRKRFGRSGNVKFDIVAHSMGGLVARYYLRYGKQPLPGNGGLPSLTWAGARNVENAVLVGTPNGGSLKAMAQLCEGLDLTPLIAQYPAALLGTMPAVYELLPRSRHGVLLESKSGIPLDLLDFDLWKTNEWGLANPEEEKVLTALLPGVKDPVERRAIALDHLEKCLENAARFHAALDRKATPPPGTRLTLYAGDALDTPVVARTEPRKVEIMNWAPGDGTVPRYSAVMDDRAGSKSSKERLVTPIDWHDVNFLFESHLGLTQSKTFADSLLFLLLEQ